MSWAGPVLGVVWIKTGGEARSTTGSSRSLPRSARHHIRQHAPGAMSLRNDHPPRGTVRSLAAAGAHLRHQHRQRGGILGGLVALPGLLRLVPVGYDQVVVPLRGGEAGPALRVRLPLVTLVEAL